MKKVLIIAALTSLIGCQSSKKRSTTNWLDQQVILKSECPENGTCSATRQPGTGIEQNIEVKEVYPQIVQKEEMVLIQYEFNRKKAEQNYADDFHKEELFIEIPAKAFKKEYKNEELQEVNLIFGRHCYCKGFAGYYKITEGNLKIENSENKTKIKLSFKAPVPQLYQNIEFIVES